MASRITPLRLGEERASHLERIVPWGQRDALFRRVVDALVEAHEEQGPEVIAGILNGSLKVQFN
jgi:adenine/guanine phosphoribosyltransferase-like PRPP-binding protein